MSTDTNIYVGSYLLVHSNKDLYDLMEKHFKNGNLFTNPKIEGKSFLVSNLNDSSSQGGLRVEKDGFWDYPKKDFSHKDWQKVMDMLEKENISFEKKTGVLMWDW